MTTNTYENHSPLRPDQNLSYLLRVPPLWSVGFLRDRELATYAPLRKMSEAFRFRDRIYSLVGRFVVQYRHGKQIPYVSVPLDLLYASLGGVSNVDIDENNALQVKAIGVAISTFETLPPLA
jgi:hypothetical protein